MKFKSQKVKDRFSNVHPVLQQMVLEMDEWVRNTFYREFTITETWTTAIEDHKLNRTSATHREGRAVDIRTKDLPTDLVEAFQIYFNTLYEKRLGAQTQSGANLIHFKPHGTGPHFHIQIRRGVSPTLKLNKYYDEVRPLQKGTSDGTT